MKRIMVLLLGILLLVGAASAEETKSGILGKPFPDFTVTDTEGNTFTLSEALKDHEAVLINFWATWCGPCRREFPYLNKAYEQYGDRVAFIALSAEAKDTVEKIAEYRETNGISFPMGRDENEELYRYIETNSLPATVVVDRFGNAVFFHSGAFDSVREPALILEAFLGGSYTETTVLNEIPRGTSTESFPVSAARAIYPESGNYQMVTFYTDAFPKPINGYIIPDDSSIRLRIEIAADDDVVNMTYMDLYQYTTLDALSLLDSERGVYVYDQEMPDAEDEEQFVQIYLFNRALPDEDSSDELIMFLFRDEASIDDLMDKLKATGAEARWEYADTEEKAQDTPQAYIMHALDQDNNPVEEVSVTFCTDTACVPQESDENGLIIFTGAPDVYHVEIVDVPDGYSYDEDFEMYTAREYGEWVLRIKKD